MRLGVNHASGAGMIAEPVDLKSSSLPLLHDCTPPPRPQHTHTHIHLHTHTYIFRHTHTPSHTHTLYVMLDILFGVFPYFSILIHITQKFTIWRNKSVSLSGLFSTRRIKGYIESHHMQTTQSQSIIQYKQWSYLEL